jgi:hypothetical protein
MTEEKQPRVYFTVLDEAGKALPAVEYWAGCMDSDGPFYDVVPLRRFIKLLGSSEPLSDTGTNVFIGVRTGRRFVRAETGGRLADGEDRPPGRRHGG